MIASCPLPRHMATESPVQQVGREVAMQSEDGVDVARLGLQVAASGFIWGPSRLAVAVRPASPPSHTPSLHAWGLSVLKYASGSGLAAHAPAIKAEVVTCLKMSWAFSAKTSMGRSRRRRRKNGDQMGRRL